MSARTGITEQHAADLAVAEYDPAFVDPGHGHSRAAWISIVVMLVAIAVGTLFFFLEQPIVVWISAAVTLVGAILWPVLTKVGLGEQGH
ncbi:hypothetical protein OVA14_11195 [Agrococcus sp. SL85]|uniref:DUF6704 family protein n=1 Tax=Agrococcus sp. SL85 TaxID=2995141 RepID=UPI00226C9009|nr:DUF6704 family protein [Agrococcus sp. SL85]WAC65860.1 hypothetical protein OVA14_11195 [Agrococcus sp. SL85]